MEPTFSVAELAHAAVPDESDHELLIRRIRHWTLAGVLAPIGQTHAGTGRHRRYANGTKYLCAILNLLSDWSLPVGVLQSVASELARERTSNENQEPLWKAAIAGSEMVFLVIYHSDSADRNARGEPGLAIVTLEPEAEAVRILREMPGAIFVNLTLCFELIS